MNTPKYQVALEGKNIVKCFHSGDTTTQVLKGISLQVMRGEFVSIMGQSGSGKSTLLYILSGLDSPTSGSVYINGTDISSFQDEKMSRIRRQQIGFVFQFYNLIPNLNIEENIMLPLLLDGKKPTGLQETAKLYFTNGKAIRQKKVYSQAIIRWATAAGSYCTGFNL